MENFHANSYRNIGIFWDAENSINLEIDHPFAEAILKIARGADGCENKVSTAKIIGGCMKIDFRMKEIVQNLGFELFDSVLSNPDVDSDVLMLCCILTWLWDYDAIYDSPSNNCGVVIVAPSFKLSGLLKSLKDREVHVVIVTDMTLPGCNIWQECTDVIHDLHDLVEKQHFQLSSIPTIKKSSQLVNNTNRNQFSNDLNAGGNNRYLSDNFLLNNSAMTVMAMNANSNPLQPEFNGYFSNSSTSNSVYHQPMLPTPARAIEQLSTISTNGSTHMRHLEQEFNRFSMSPSQENFDHVKDEQLQLQDELKLVYQAQNVQATVSLLRKIYTKQYKTFRIPTLLANIPQRHSFQTDCIFFLGCINWCFGGQKGSNTEAFTYKMNRNVARWLLKDIQRREVPVRILVEVSNTAVVTVQSILNQVPEFDLMFEILQWMGRQDLDTILVPYINIWSMSANMSQVKKARDFANELRRHIDLNPPVPLVAAAGPPGLGTLRRSLPEYQMPLPVPSLPSNALLHQPNYSFSNMNATGRVSGLTGIEHSSFNMMPTTGHVPKMVDSYVSNSSILQDLNAVRDRLYGLLTHFPSGILGARIPEIYQLEYQQSLQLYGKKLKDMLLSFPDVEMVGIGGPGDKMFRIVRRDQQRGGIMSLCKVNLGGDSGGSGSNGTSGGSDSIGGGGSDSDGVCGEGGHY